MFRHFEEQASATERLTVREAGARNELEIECTVQQSKSDAAKVRRTKRRAFNGMSADLSSD